MSTRTWAVVTPFFTSTTLPLNWLRALSLMALSVFIQGAASEIEAYVDTSALIERDDPYHDLLRRLFSNSLPGDRGAARHLPLSDRSRASSTHGIFLREPKGFSRSKNTWPRLAII